MTDSPLHRWHDYASGKLTDQPDSGQADNVLADLLADEVVFHSPVVHTPQQGKAITHQYLSAAMAVFSEGPFEYLNEWHSDDGAVLEFQAELNGIVINGADMIRWNEKGEIIEFKVMVRPLKAVNMLHQMMGAALESG